jgi:hypothetical protein
MLAESEVPTLLRAGRELHNGQRVSEIALGDRLYEGTLLSRVLI